MKILGIIFPNQLFPKAPISKHCEALALLEYSLHFGEKKYISNFHKKKLILHRASMKHYMEHELKNFNSHYFEFKNSNLDEVLNKYPKLEKVVIYDPKDFLILKRIKKSCHLKNLEIEIIENPMFLTPPEFYNNFFEKRKYFMTPFYIEQRKRLNILVKRDKPLHDKWTFDTENRLKLPKNLEIPNTKFFGENKYVSEATKYIKNNFENNLGESDNFTYPISSSEAKQLLNDFLKHKLENFGPYEDAISSKNNILFHSNLSSSINIGLLTPSQVVEETLEYAQNHKVHFPSLEGFIRQIIGWREFMMIVYEKDGVKQRNSNYFNHQNKIPKSFYNLETNLEPLDNVLRKVNSTAYAHHIERLMILGNFMCLCEIHPNEVYRWFMENFIDAYDWVMVPNIYGMSQYADEGLMTTKPYISSSNYILKMSDFSSKDKWCEVWDGLFWRFLAQNEKFLAKNPRIGLLTKQLSNQSVRQKIKVGEKYLNQNF